MLDNDGAVVSCEIHVNTIQACDDRVASADGLSAQGHFIAFFIFHINIHCIRIYLLICKVLLKSELHSRFLRMFKRIADSLIIRMVYHFSGDKSDSQGTGRVGT